MANQITITVNDQDTASTLDGVTVNIKDVATDTSVGSGTTASGQVTIGSLVAGTAYYVELSKTGYDSYVKAGQYQQGQLRFTHNASGADEAVTVQLRPTRSRTQVQVFEGIGAAAGSPQTAVTGATVVIKKTSDNSTLETLTTDNDGVAYLDDSVYTAIGAIYAVISKNGYNSKTVYFGTSSLGDVIGAQLTQAVAHTTYTLSGTLIGADGTPISGKVLKLKHLKGLTSVNTGGSDYHVATSVQPSATTDANGDFSFTLVDGSIVQPVGWASYFGYPDNVAFTMSANIALGDGTTGTL